MRLQASGKFDLKEPYYRQLNPQASAVWPQQEQAAASAVQLPPPAHQSYVQQMQQDPAQVQPAASYGWSAPQQGVQQYAVVRHEPQDGSQPPEVSQWNQQGHQQQMWR